MEMQQKRQVVTDVKSGLGAKEIILVAVLLAAGAVLKFLAGSVINIAGMKPNFIIAMYCLAILLIKPRLLESAIIGVLAGALCQLFPGTPYINFASEIAGAVLMGILIHTSIKIKGFSLTPIVATLLSTILSGAVYTVLLFAVAHADASAMIAYVPIVLCTALFNAAIVQALYIPLGKVVGR